ncbi:hypothetical protein GIB67_001713, partial [Kingdonia uniflora]
VNQGVDVAEHYDDLCFSNLSTALNNSLDQDTLVIPDSFHNISKTVELEKVVSGKATSEDPTIEFNKVVQDAMTALYPGCKGFTVLTFVIILYKLKVTHNWSEISFTELLQVFQEVLPPDNKALADSYRTSKIISQVGLDYEEIDACPNDCILYWKENALQIECPTFGASRYKEKTKFVAKVQRYFPLTPRLQRMYSVPWVAKVMTWHSTGKM